MKYRFLNLKYALINIFYMFLICSTVGYAANFLLAKGFSNSAVGAVLSCVSIFGVVLQAVFAPLIDRSDKLTEKGFVSITLIITTVIALAMYFMPDASVLLLVLTTVSFSAASSGLPFINSIAFIYEKVGQTINYGLCRGLGSAAYAFGSLLIGRFLSISFQNGRLPSDYLPLIYASMALFTLIMVQTLETPEAETSTDSPKAGKINYGQFFRKYSHILPVLVGMVMIYTCHMLINNFMIHVITNVGGDSSNQGTALFIQAMSELPPMFLFAKIMQKKDVDSIMALAGICFTVKHLLVWLAPDIRMLYLSMAVQMLGYALLIPSSVYFANKHFDEQDRNQGQAVTAWTTTIGGIIASLLGGVLMDHLAVSTVLLIGFLISLAGTLLMVKGIASLKKG
ncbi:MAG: MFS transporter [Solobacterium sp.]|nr:MFS transporter [Solobacterium sp.]